jgi:hypothetical protein
MSALEKLTATDVRSSAVGRGRTLQHPQSTQIMDNSFTAGAQ